MADKEQQNAAQAQSIPKDRPPVPWYGYVSLIFAIVFFSGIFAQAQGWLQVFDYTSLLGKYGNVAAVGDGATTFVGKGGIGARQGFIFGLAWHHVSCWHLVLLRLSPIFRDYELQNDF